MKKNIAVLLSLVVLCSTLALDAQVRSNVPIPDLAGYRTLKCDFHMHTVFSDGDVWPTTRVTEAWLDGLDAISITDHSDYHPHKADVKVDLTRPFLLARQAAEDYGLILIPGVEITKGSLHCNALFVTDPNVFGEVDLLTALRRAREQGAFVFWNHPGWKEKAQWFPPMETAYREGLLQGIEVINGSTIHGDAFPWISERNLTILANGDTHRPVAFDYAKRPRPATLLFVTQAGAEGVREALKAHRSVAWMGGELWGAEKHLKGLWEGAVKLQINELLVPAGGRRVQIRLRNDSALTFKLRVTKAPAWLQIRPGEIPPESTSVLSANITKDAPAGRRDVEVEIELTNLHTGPGKNLVVSLPLTVNVKE